MPHPFLYEINTRCWLNLLSDREGIRVTLATVPDAELLRWQQLGFTHIWLMGVWRTGDRTLATALASEGLRRECEERWPGAVQLSLAASPYAIADYQVTPEFGGDSGLEAFRRRLHRRGMRLLLDFVPNHLGLDHCWLRERPDLFVQSPTEAAGTFLQETSGGSRWLAHAKDPYFPPWIDTAQIDYRVPAARAAMQQTLLGVAEKCDGVRCDMAMLVLNDVFEKTWAEFPALGEPSQPLGDRPLLETHRAGPSNEPEFWQEAISSTKKAYPGFVFLAEAYWGLEKRLQSLGFDFSYDKVLYDGLVHRDVAGVQRHLNETEPGFLETSAHFLENHDEPRIASILSLPEHRAAALLILSLPGMRFLHDGQLRGARIKVPVQFTRWPEEPAQPEIERLYERLLLTLQKTAVGQGQATVLQPKEAWPGNPTTQDIVLIQWQSEPQAFDLAVVNLAPHRSQCYAPLTVGNLADHDWRLRDLLGSEKHERSGKDLQKQGLYLDLPENGAQLFHFLPQQRPALRLLSRATK